MARPSTFLYEILTGYWRKGDNPTAGNLREIYARNCYLEGLKVRRPVDAVLDAGANRGMFSILALTHLGARTAVGVEPMSNYIPVLDLLLKANKVAAERCPRYSRFLTSPALERRSAEERLHSDDSQRTEDRSLSAGQDRY